MKTNVKKKSDHGNGKGHAARAVAAPAPVAAPQELASGVRLQDADHEPIRNMNNEISAMKNAMSDLSMQIWMFEQRRNELATKIAQTGQALDTKIKEAVKAVGVDITQGNMRLDMDSMILHRT